MHLNTRRPRGPLPMVGAVVFALTLAACSDAKVDDEGGGGFYGDDGGDGAADGAADGAGDGAADGASDGGGGGGAGGGGSTGGGTDAGDGSADDGWDGGGSGSDSDGEVPTPDWSFDEGAICEDKLSLQLHVIDLSGSCTDCVAGPMWLGAAAYNPCEIDLELSLDGGQLIAGGSAEGPSGVGMGWSSGSDGSVERLVLAPGEAVMAAESLGSLEPGDWRFSITFGDAGRYSDSTSRALR